MTDALGNRDVVDVDPTRFATYYWGAVVLQMIDDEGVITSEADYFFWFRGSFFLEAAFASHR